MKYYSQIKPIEFNLKNWRENMGLSLRDLAKVVGVTAGQICKLEQGKSVMPARNALKFFKRLSAWQDAKKPEVQYNFFPVLTNF